MRAEPEGWTFARALPVYRLSGMCCLYLIVFQDAYLGFYQKFMTISNFIQFESLAWVLST